MLGRGALADPALGRKAARELGILGATLVQPPARAETAWKPLILRYAELCTTFGLPSFYILSRVKQWLRMINHDGKSAWFDALKGCQELGELLNWLSDAEVAPLTNLNDSAALVVGHAASVPVGTSGTLAACPTTSAAESRTLK